MRVSSLRTLFACNRGRAENATAFALLDELYRGILVAEERALDVHVYQAIQVFGGCYEKMLVGVTNIPIFKV